MTKIWALPGGIHPPENKTQSLASGLQQAGIPERLVFPLSQHIGAPAKPVVSAGDHVRKGQLIAEATGFVSAPVHASTSGNVVEISPQAIPHPSGLKAPCIVIEPDGRDEWIELQPIPNYKECEKDILIKRIHHAGIAGMGGAGFPSHVKLSPSPQHKIDTLIINGTECEPYITADDMLMRLRAKEIIRGTKILSYILDKPERVIIGIEDNKPEAIRIMREAARGSSIEIATFPTKYPSGGEKQLIWILTGKEVPTGGLPAHIGIVVQNIGTTEAVYNAVIEGKPLVSRFTTVTGNGVSKPGNFEVLLGTPVNYLLQQSGFEASRTSRLIIGGPMMGYTVEEDSVPVVKTTNCILAASNEEVPRADTANPCIRCGMCAQACPVSLLPQQLYWHAQAQDDEKLMAHNLMDCIECGCCSYVCPSNIPLVQYYRAAKSAIRTANAEKIKSDKARLRFEAKKQRQEKEAEEKAARQRARQEAAKAKKDASTTSASDEKPDPVKQAVEKARASGSDIPPEQQLEKLKKALESALTRLARAEEKVANAEAENSPQLDQLKARLADMQVNVDKAKDKLQSFEASQTVEKTLAKAQDIRASRTDRERLDEGLQKLQIKREALQNQLNDNGDAEGKLTEKMAHIDNKIAETRAEIAQLGEHSSKSVNPDAAAAAIEKAKSKIAEQQNMTPREKLENQLTSLEERLTKARTRLEAAIAENSENIEAFETALKKLQSKRDECKAQLEAM